MNLPNRQSIRLPDYDYSGAGDYFITMCIQNRECLLGHIENGLMVPNEYGLLVNEIWKDLSNHYPGLQLGAWVVMPNHVHGVLILTEVGAIHVGAIHVGAIHVGAIHVRAIHVRAIHVRAIHESPLPKRDERRKMLLSKIIGRFKMTTGKQINLSRKTPGAAVWQRNYYEHIIRDDQSFVNIENYIVNNPENWDVDKENTNPENR